MEAYVFLIQGEEKTMHEQKVMDLNEQLAEMKTDHARELELLNKRLFQAETLAAKYNEADTDDLQTPPTKRLKVSVEGINEGESFAVPTTVPLPIVSLDFLTEC